MIKSFLKSGASLIFAKQTTILSAATVIMLIGLLSRILGLVRDRALVSYFSPHDLDVYFAASRFPNLIFDFIVAGTLTAAFIPVFSQYHNQSKEKEGFEVASTVITLSLFATAILTLVYFVFANPLSRVVAPGFSGQEIVLMTNLTRVMLLSQIFLILANYLTGIAHSYQRFLIPAVSLALYNVGIIWGTALFSPQFGLYGPALGMVVGAFLYFISQIPLIRHLGFKFSWRFDYHHLGVQKIISLTIPRLAGLVMIQADVTLDVILASLLSRGALTYFTFAQHLQFFPVGLFGLTISQAALPILSIEANKKNLVEFKRLFVSTLHEMAFIVIPVSVAILVLRIPFVRLIFGASRFTWESTVTTGYVIAAYSLSIFFQSLTYYVARGFFALQNTMAPVKIQVACTLLGMVLSSVSVLVFHQPVWSIALAYSLATLVQAALLIFFLDREVEGFNRRQLIIPFLKISFASLVSGLVMYVLMKLFDRSAWDQRLSFLGSLSLPENFDKFVVDTRYTKNLIALTTFVGSVGALTYLLMVWLLKIEEIKVFIKLFTKFRLPTPKFLTKISSTPSE